MKKLLAIFAALLIVSACNTQDSIVNYDTNESVSTAKQFIPLPEPKDASLLKQFTITGVIDNVNGGSLTIDDSYTATDGRNVTVYATIDFGPASFSGGDDVSYDISMTVDDETTSETFYPHIVFQNAPTYNVTYTGLDLTNVDPSTVDFVFMDSDGNVEYISYDGINVDVDSGTLSVSNAKLPHFSRYGFLN
ncbi:MAG: hypothetical protein JW995_15405 [Melioribacteraceae bacterium]|nr:hypothetical protein [Melioribacteraceae bacterium]